MKKMFNKKMGVGALTAILLLAVMVPLVPIATAQENPNANAANVINCDSTSPISTGTIDGNIMVPDGETCNIHAVDGNITINGDIRAGKEAVLQISTVPFLGHSLIVNGGIFTAGGDRVSITGVAGNHVVITESVQIVNTINGITVAYVDIAGSAQFNNNLQFYSISNSKIGGNVQINANASTETSPYFNNVSGNEITGNLQCQTNSPAPVALFALNTVDGKAQGQCAELV